MKAKHEHTILHEACLDCWTSATSDMSHCIICHRYFTGGKVNLCISCLESEYLRLKGLANED
jgi:hypothetical protein